MITPEPPAGSEHYREGWRHGYEQAAIDRERSTDAARLVPESEVQFVLDDNERMLAQHAADVAEIERLRQLPTCDPSATYARIATRAVPDTGQAREPAPEQPDALLAAELRTLVKRYEAVARKYGDRWHGWGVEMRDTAFCLRATLEKIEQRQVESSGDTGQGTAVAALAYARSEVDKWLADGDPYCILPTRTEHIPALLARLDELEGTS